MARARGKYSSTLQSGAVNLILVFLIVRDRAIQILLSVSFFWGGGLHIKKYYFMLLFCNLENWQNTYNVVKYFVSKENTVRLENYILQCC